MVGEAGEVAAGVVLDPTLQIDGVHAVDADQQHVLVAVSLGMSTVVIIRLRERDAAGKHRRRDRGS